jgi:hypothetical protein
MLRLILFSLALVVLTSCPKPPPTMRPNPPPQAPEDIGKLAPPPVSPSPEVRGFASLARSLRQRREGDPCAVGVASMLQPASDGVANLPPSAHSRVGTLMKPDLIPLAAWMMWEVFFDEPEPTDAHRKDDQRREPREVKPPPRSR